ncbi:MAG: NAD-dependent DNA ligase LigA [Candidatus Cloacimonetes bacterium]|nr:NAD-dependent DNA ligase LigA [Candidatus Cloacimonadota bacterium]
MNSNTLPKDIAKLRKELERHNLLYYEFANPEISDYEYDQLANQLKTLEMELSGEIPSDSPVQTVGSDLRLGAKVISHKVRMASLDNAYSLEEVESFIAKTKLETGRDNQYCAELKIDGFGINLFFDKGTLQYASTRGDGNEGEDVTVNFKLLPDIPHNIEYQEQIEIRGEIYMPLQDFLALNELRRELEAKPFANPRNAAAGSIKLKDTAELKNRRLRAIFYSLGYYDEATLPVNSQYALLAYLEKLGFPTSKRALCSTYQEVEQFCQMMEQDRYTLPYDIDGIVIKLNELEQQKRLGYTGKSPKWAVAYKFKPEEKYTTVESVNFQVGRTGAITPVANLKPVFISGSTVSRATLHNEDEIIRLDLRVGDTVRIVKSGEIIPKILSVDILKRPELSIPVSFPMVCPVCSSSLERDPEGSINYCANAACPAQLRRKIEHFASRDAMDISGLGESLIARFIDEKIIHNIQDIYNLDYEKIATMERLGTKSAENLKQAVELSKRKNFDRCLYALGIRHVGLITARNLAQSFGDIDALISADKDALLSVPDIGDIVAESLISFFSKPENLGVINALKKTGLCFTQESELVSNALVGKSYLITGTLPGYGRKEMESLITKHGGKILGSVSKQLNYLVVGDNPGSKLDKARKLGTVEIITESDILASIDIKG